MKRFKWVGLAMILLIALALACGGNGEETQPPPTQPPPTAEPPETPTEEPTVGGLDFMLEPNFGEIDLESGFLPDPYEIALISGGSVDVDTLGIGSDCTGYATSSPDYRIHWSGSSSRLRIFFVPDTAGDDATLIINNPSGGWLCNDDYSDWNPLVEINDPDEGQYDIWVGSYSGTDFIAGTLYVTELDLGPADYVGGGGEVIAQWAIDASASSEYGNPDWGAVQATGAPDTDACGDIRTAWASATSTGLDWLELTYGTAVIPTEINVYETHSPGFIVEVKVIDEDGYYYSIWEGEPELDAECPRVFSLSVSGVDFPITGIRLNLDQTDGSWNEIDAVELIGTTP
ncbi:MAG: hypothetical protein JW900_03615 [Anaerolineae bacterium]|nr:hypothetical protein [Anaerolineae bacterium]